MTEQPRRVVDGTSTPGAIAQATGQKLRELIPTESAGRTSTKRGIAVSTTAVKIVHGLGRAVVGWRAIRIRGVAAVALAETASDNQTITVIASAAGTIDIEVW